MKIRKNLLAMFLFVLASACLACGAVLAQADETVGGWYNHANGASQIRPEGGGAVIDLAGNSSFGSSFVLNDDLASGLYGGFRMSFDLDVSLTKGEEVWVSALPLYDEEEETAHRVGLHFNGNDWMDIAVYGTLAGQDKGFAHVVNKNDSFPALTETIHAEITLEYDAQFHAIETLELNGEEIYRVDLSELYGNGYFLFDTASVGFDSYVVGEQATVSNVQTVAVESEYTWHRASINNYYAYAKTADEFTSRRLSVDIDTPDEVRAFTENAGLLSGMFTGELSHNYIFNASVRALTERSGSEIGFYVWYRDLNNYILLSGSDGTLTLRAVLGGQTVGTETAPGTIGQGDSVRVQKYSNLGQTSVTVILGEEEALSLQGLAGFDENYCIGLYAKNVAVTLEDVGTESFYVPYDFVEADGWITSGFSETAWNVTDGAVSVETKNDHTAEGYRTWSVAVTDKVVNDTEASYTTSFSLSLEGDHAYGIVPYYADSANYVMLGVQRVGGAYSLIAVSAQNGVEETQSVSAPADSSLTVRRKGTEFSVEAGGGSLHVTLEGLTEISEYYGYFVSGQGSAQVGELTFEGFESFRLYEQENGWTTSSVQKNDITFGEDGSVEINGNYTEAGLTSDTDQRLAMAIRPETYRNDYVIETKLTRTIEPSGSCQREGIVAWYLDENNYFVIFIDQWTVWEAFQVNACGVYNGERMVDTSFNDYPWFLGTKDTPGYIDQTFDLRVLRNGQTIKAWVNDDLIFSKTFDKAEYDLTVYDDDELYLGAFAAGLGTKFENYGVRAMTAEEGTPTPPAGNRPADPDPDDPGNPDPGTPDPEDPNGASGGCGGCGGTLGGPGLSAGRIAWLVAAAAALCAVFLKKRRKN